jgi:hypothetical protein
MNDKFDSVKINHYLQNLFNPYAKETYNVINNNDDYLKKIFIL